MRKHRWGGNRSRLVIAAFLVLFFLLIAVISGGLVAGLGYGGRPRPFGWILFIGGSVLAMLTVDRRARVLPGIFGAATLNGIIILSSGHALNQPAAPVPRSIGAMLTIVMAAAAAITASFANKDLTNTDRAAYLGILSCFVAMLACAMIPIKHWEVPACIGLVACVALLWVRRFVAMKTGANS